MQYFLSLHVYTNTVDLFRCNWLIHKHHQQSVGTPCIISTIHPNTQTSSTESSFNSFTFEYERKRGHNRETPISFTVGNIVLHYLEMKFLIEMFALFQVMWFWILSNLFKPFQYFLGSSWEQLWYVMINESIISRVKYSLLALPPW